MPPFLHWIGYPSNPRHHLRRVGGRGGGLFRMGMRACAVRTPPILLLLFLFAQDWMMLNGDSWTFNYDLAPEAGKPFPRIRCSQPWRLGGQRRCLSVYFFSCCHDVGTAVASSEGTFPAHAYFAQFFREGAPSLYPVLCASPRCTTRGAGGHFLFCFCL